MLKQSPFINIHSHHTGNKGDITVMNIREKFDQPNADHAVSLGLHPQFINLRNWQEEFNQLKEAANHPNVMAIGECGLDRLADVPFSLQSEIFVSHILLSKALQKPLIIHCVRAFEEVLLLLKKFQPVSAVFHGFRKSGDLAKKIIDAGFYLSFGNGLNSSSTASIFPSLPANRIFLETDNDPLTIQAVYNKAAELRQCALDTLLSQIDSNFKELFKQDTA